MKISRTKTKLVLWGELVAILNVRDQFCLGYGNKCQTKTHFLFINKFTSINRVQWNYCCCCFYWFFLFFSISKHSAFAFSIILNRMLSLFWWWRNTHTHILLDIFYTVISLLFFFCAPPTLSTSISVRISLQLSFAILSNFCFFFYQ